MIPWIVAFVGFVLVIAGTVLIINNSDGYTRTIIANVSCAKIKSAGPSSAGPSSAGPSSAGPSSAGPSTCTYTFDVDGKSYSGTSESELTTETVRVKYKPDDPNFNKIDDGNINMWGPILFLVGIALAFGGVAVGFSQSS
jgi:uncharacterized membrane protein